MTQAQPGIRLASILMVLVSLTASVTPAIAEEQANSALTKGQFAGIFVGTGQSSNDLVDINGFADWGNPGSTTGYNKSGAVGGAFFGQQSDNFRYEMEFMLGDLSAHTKRLDPGCTDESATSKLNWTLAARFGVAKSVGQTRAFAVAGPALASIDNSVTDIDYSGSTCLESDLRLDADDSFRDSSTRFGWTLGLGIETEVAPNWLLRFEGVYFDFGKEGYQVNLSRNNPCGPGGPKTPCSYSVENRFTTLRIGLVHYFE